VLKTTYTKIGVGRFCMLFGNTRHAYYDKLWRQEKQGKAEAIVLEMVRARRINQPKVGTEKLHLMLKDEFKAHNIKMGRDGLHELLQANYLTVKKRKRRYVVTTDSNHPFYKYPNKIKHIKPSQAEIIWVCDITYIMIAGGDHSYLSLITDAYSKKIVGYHLHQNLKAEGCLIALRMALSQRTKLQNNLIHHSDRGIQYCSDDYTNLLIQSGISISMAEAGNPYENAIAERVNETLKYQLGLKEEFPTHESAFQLTVKAIQIYNEERLHMSCNNLTPSQAHSMTGELEKKWKPKKYYSQSIQNAE
jgi:transposase InsO family protein